MGVRISFAAEPQRTSDFIACHLDVACGGLSNRGKQKKAGCTEARSRTSEASLDGSS